jgi:hypothetical protein
MDADPTNRGLITFLQALMVIALVGYIVGLILIKV